MPRLPPRIPRQVPGKSVVKAEQKRERRAEDHVELVRQLPCAATGRPPRNDPHHVMRVGPGERGMSLTTGGRWTIPLSRAVHREITPHGDPEAVLLARYGVLARELATALWAASPDLEAMERIVRRHHQEARLRMKAGSEP